ncbi:MAG: arginine--tRNA ligase [Gammaproteobacteria bacterium]|nr:arginine--tRNA ligase [Gammaproteobacteria bacterium]MBT8150841.1 arginine--tRNA ligase [Gammaproteobacteria bacterium]NND38591.1 arginine--tRNA ligase [Pseudomonadales bacterium]NNL11551.1 arginine--tRNA ligase [Pseudomonadales bacterium]NNM11761.1 arginine--tRNA ligase [Pseudomonadales bacterium]
MKQDIQRLLSEALVSLASTGLFPDTDIPEPKLEATRDPAHGDLASNIALALAKRAGIAPRELANKIIQAVPANDVIEKIELAGPGFINFFVSQASQMQCVAEILQAGDRYGHSGAGRDGDGKARPVQVEFVSANPTGPLHVGHGRGAAVGDSLCRLLEASGWDVTREFYYNDAGQQINNLATSVQLRAKGIGPDSPEWPEDGYQGEYITELAASYLRGEMRGDIKAAADPDDVDAIRSYAVAYLREEQDRDLQAFGVRFDVFSLESALYTDGKVDKVVAQLVDSGHCYEKDGALWLRTTDFGDDKDRVMRKSDGGYTYFVPDVAYHLEKWRRGFSKVVNEQGADHHSTITRVRAGLQALDVGIPEGWPDYVLHQMVTVLKNGEEVKISKRAGSYVTLQDLIEQTGADATRFFLVARRADSQLTFDIDLALQRSNENPVYYIQYAHARVCSALRNASEKFQPYDQPQGLENLGLLQTAYEAELAGIIAQYPERVATAACELAPHNIANYLRDVAAALHSWYASGNQDKTQQWLVQDDALRNARLCLAEASRQVIANGLHLLGVSAPQEM